jgi:hypothetical protein
MAFKGVESAQNHRRKLNGCALLLKILKGAIF